MLFIQSKKTGAFFDAPLTVAVATAVDDHGCTHKLIAQSRSNRLDSRLAMLKMPDEEFVPGPYHAERNITLAYHHCSWLEGQPITATRIICDSCMLAIAMRKMRPVGLVFHGGLVQVGSD